MHTDKPGFKGSLDAAGADLPLLLRAAGAMQPDSALSDYGRKLGTVKDRSFQVKTDFDADLKSGNIDLPALDARGLGLSVAGRLAAKNMESDKGSVNGELTVKGQSLGELLRAVEQPGLAESLQSVEFDARISGTRADLNLKPLQLRAVVAGAQVGKTPAEIALKADTRINMDAEQLDLAGLSLTGLGLNISGDVKGAKILSTPEFSGKLNVAPFNLRKLMGQLQMEPPAMADNTALSKVALQSEFSGSQTAIDLRQLALALDESNLNGNFSFNNPEQPVIRFGLGIDQINFDRYLPPESAGKTPATPESAAAAAATQLPVELLRKLDIQGNLQVGQLTYAKARLQNVRLTVSGKGGTLKLDPVTAQLYQGTYSGAVSLDATGKLPRLTLNSKLSAVEFEPLLRDTQGKAKLRGNGDFSAALIAAGADTDTMKKTINGQMSFVIRNGAVKGFNLGKILRGVKQFKKHGDFNVESQEETDFTELTGNPVATNGIVRLDDFAGKSPLFRFSGKGVIADLPRDRIDYTVSATVVGTSKGQGGAELAQLDGITIPVDIKGPRDNPKISPDLGAVIASLAQKEAKEQLLKQLGVEQAPGTGTATQPAADPQKELLDKALKSIFD
jgi:AsmA protein